MTAAVVIGGVVYEWPRYRVTNGVHRYHHRAGKPSVCVKCGTRMRRKNPAAAPEYRAPGAARFDALNPGCPAR